MFFPHLAEKFSELLKSVKGRKIAVVGHMRPDGDCVASQFALADIFMQVGAADVVCLNQNEIPRLYGDFTYGRCFVDAEAFTDLSYDVITVDCADYKRTNLTFCGRFPEPLGCVDHHQTNNSVAKINIIEPTASATAELIAGLALDAGLKILPENATQLYMGIVMDTRQFTTSNTRALTFEIASKLIECGADAADVARQLYQRESSAKLNLLAEYLSTLKYYENGKISIGELRKGVYERTGAKKEDSDGLVDYGRAVDGVEIALQLEELQNGVKGSLRAKNQSGRVNEIAAMFGGGGHLAAAGFTADGETIATFYEKILEILKAHLKKIDA